MSRLGLLVIFLFALTLIATSSHAGLGSALALPAFHAYSDTAKVNALLLQARRQVRSDIKLADSLANQVLRILDDTGYPEGLVSCLILLSEINVKTGNLDAAWKHASRATRISGELDNPKLISECYNQRYLLYFQQGDYDSAMVAAERSLGVAETVGHKTMIARGHQSFGILNSIKGNHSKAIEHFLLSERHYQMLDDSVALAFLLGNLGVTFEESGNLEKALEYMKKELALSVRINDKSLQGWALTNIGSVYSMQGMPDSALHYYFRSLRIAETIPDADLMITNFDNIGTYWSAANRFDSATHYLMSALRLAEELGFNYQEVYVVGHIAKNYFEMGKPDSALLYAEEQLALATSQQLQVDQKLAYALIAKIHAGKDQYRQAYNALTNYVAVNDTLYNEEKIRQIEELRENYEAEKKDQQIAILREQKEAADFKRNTYVFAGMVVILFLLLLYNRQRIVSAKNRQLVEKGREVEKMKSRFFANISHEFRTPLTLILGPIETLNDSIEKADQKYQLGVMQKNANRMLTLTNQLLDLSKLEAGSMRLTASPRDIVPLIKGVVMSFDTMAEIKNISLITSFESDHQEVWIEAEKIETVIINLLSNAIKFTSSEGGITVSQSVDGRHCQITVADDGEGISEDDMAHIFDRFYQGADDKDYSPQGATGIGLALAKELVELHYGTIEAKSVPGKGTSVTFSLPLGKDHLASDEMIIIHGDSGADIHGRHPHREIYPEEMFSPAPDTRPLLLVIEDNSDVMTYLKTILSSRYLIIEAHDGARGIEVAFETIPDLIVCDVMMPLKNGYEVCATLKQDQRTSHIPTILLTARSSPDDRIRGLRSMADDYLVKPFLPKELEVRIENLIESRKKLREKYNRHILLMPEETELTSVDEAFLNSVKKAIEANMANELFSVEQLGKEVGMSRSQIHRKLHALMNQSASQFIRVFRLTRAKSMIEQNAGTISEIAYSVGFSSPSYFSQCFLQYFGSTPTEVRSQARILKDGETQLP